MKIKNNIVIFSICRVHFTVEIKKPEPFSVVRHSVVDTGTYKAMISLCF